MKQCHICGDSIQIGTTCDPCRDKQMKLATVSPETPDYGEPWYFDDDADLALTRYGSVGDEHRIVECVNACAGMADPAEEIQAMRDAIKEASIALDLADDEIDPPDTNCSCHINPPCNDCVDHSQARETKEFIKSTLDKLKPFLP